MDLIVETSEDMFSAQGVKVNRRIQPLFKEGVSMWAELENKWVLNKQKKKKLLHSKGNHKQDKKTTLRMGENICK